MRGRFKWAAVAVASTCAVAIPVAAGAAKEPGHGHQDFDNGPSATQHSDQTGGSGGGSPIKHVLLISVDGMHQSDLNWYVANHPSSELAKLAGGGAQYTQANTPVPSDSDPGMTAQMTGGNPKTTGVYYDVSYSHNLLEAGTTSCHGQPTGADVVYDSPDDLDVTRLDAGQGLPNLPDSILSMTGTPQTLLNPATFPVDPNTCQTIPPWKFLKVNTIFNVAHDAGMLTAWSDKHAVYSSFNGPSGNGLSDMFAPEIDSNALLPGGAPWPGGIIWTADNLATQQYDSYKVRAVINWIDGWDHSHSQHVGVPAIFGMNFQTVSTAEKLPTSPSTGLTGGYLPGTTTPGLLLQKALDYVNNQLLAMDNEIQAQGLSGSTAIVLSAKHGQSPQDPNQLTRIDDGAIMQAVNDAWAAKHPGAAPLVVAGTDDDAIMWWLSDRSDEATRFVKHYLWSHPATGNTIDGSSRTLEHSGLAKLYVGGSAARYFGVPASEPRHPDVWGVVQVGVVYTAHRAKIAEHGGSNPADRNVPIVVYAPGVQPQVSNQWVETTQIAPTILQLLGLDPTKLDAVKAEGTPVLPGIGGDTHH